MNTTAIKVENLKCHGCASTIKKGLLNLDEIESVDIDIENSIIEVKYDGDSQNIEKFKSKLAKLGYPEAGHNNTISIAKSYYSCAIGRFGDDEN